MNNMFLSKEDYEEPRCLLDMSRTAPPIPVRRVIEKLDEHLNRNDYVSAERHLRYWLAEANSADDMHGRLTVLNEQIGLYRKIGKKAECMTAIDAALELAGRICAEDSATLGTTYINAATGYKAFGMPDKALPLYEKARTLYESVLDPYDARIGGLYNNMALALTEVGSFADAGDLYSKALSVMEKQEHGEAEMAITYLNLADLICAEIGMTEGKDIIEDYLAEAERLLNTESLPKNGYYAFVCEKCAPTFGYYGHSATEQKLLKLSKEIYERS